MSATNTPQSTKGVSHQEGQVGSHVPPSGPETTHGHQPGRIAGEKDAAPEYSAEVLPAGSAPASKTHQPQGTVQVMTHTETTSADDTITGATSSDVHTGLGHPGSGQSSRELHTDGGKTNAGGIMGRGATGAQSESDFASNQKDFSTDVPGATQKTTGEQPGRDEDRDFHNKT